MEKASPKKQTIPSKHAGIEMATRRISIFDASWTHNITERPIGYAQPKTKESSKPKVSTRVQKFFTWFQLCWLHKKKLTILVAMLGATVLMGSDSPSDVSTHMQVLHIESMSVGFARPLQLAIRPRESTKFHDLSFVGSPTQLDWMHPIIGQKIMPDKRTRIFGAKRDGKRPPECGQGHCGVDLVGPVGTPIRSVLDGVVLRANHNAKANGGRYIKIAHGDNIISYYMHLDEISENIKYGSEVKIGDVIGTLGDTDIENSPPHLHFSVATLDAQGRRTYVDPLPMLKTARSL